MMYIEFIGEPSAAGVMPYSTRIPTDKSGPEHLDSIIMMERQTIKAAYPWAVSFRVLDDNDKQLYAWPENQ